MPSAPLQRSPSDLRRPNNQTYEQPEQNKKTIVKNIVPTSSALALAQYDVVET